MWGKRNTFLIFCIVLLIGIFSGCIGEKPKVIRIEEDDPAFVYSGFWIPEENPGASGGSWMITAYGVLGFEPSKVDIKFSGTGISLLHMVLPAGGIAEITIDGVDYPSIDTYASYTGPKKTTIATDLTNSEHTLTITPSENHNPAVPPLPMEEGGPDRPIIIIDAVEVTVPP